MTRKKLHQTAGSEGPYLPDFLVEPDLDYTTPYPCGVCKREFRSRHLLATHKHNDRSTE